MLKKLREKNPEVFTRLTKYIIPAEYIEEKRHHKHYAPIINLSPLTGEIEQIRYNLNDRAALDNMEGKEIRQYYSDMTVLSREIEKMENRINIKLNPGTVMILDNWRVLHGTCIILIIIVHLNLINSYS